MEDNSIIIIPILLLSLIISAFLATSIYNIKLPGKIAVAQSNYPEETYRDLEKLSEEFIDSSGINYTNISEHNECWYEITTDAPGSEGRVIYLKYGFCPKTGTSESLTLTISKKHYDLVRVKRNIDLEDLEENAKDSLSASCMLIFWVFLLIIFILLSILVFKYII